MVLTQSNFKVVVNMPGVIVMGRPMNEPILTDSAQGKLPMNTLPGRMKKGARANIVNSHQQKVKGRTFGVSGRLNRNSVGSMKTTIPRGVRSGSNILSIGGKNAVQAPGLSKYNIGDRLHGPMSEPRASFKSKIGANFGSIRWDTPTTQAPIARASFAGGGVDSVPTVTIMTASQSRIASQMTKKRMLKNGGSNYVPSRQAPKVGNRTVPGGGTSKGNQKDRYHWTDLSTIIEPFNQADTDITSMRPNPIEPLPATDPVEQQEMQLRNFRGALRMPMESTDFPYLSGDRGLERNLRGKGNEAGPFDTQVEADMMLHAVDSIVWN